MAKDDSVPQAGTEVHSSTNVEVTSASSNDTKPNVSGLPSLSEIIKRKFSQTILVKYEVSDSGVKAKWVYLFGIIPLMKSLEVTPQ